LAELLDPLLESQAEGFISRVAFPALPFAKATSAPEKRSPWLRRVVPSSLVLRMK
jgi:hypothetical protein